MVDFGNTSCGPFTGFINRWNFWNANSNLFCGNIHGNSDQHRRQFYHYSYDFG
jgi:hypothetical protein